jgi:hypothetical protein
MPIKDDLDLQHTWIHTELSTLSLGNSFPAVKDVLAEIISNKLLPNVLSYTKYMPMAVKLTYTKLEIGVELIPVPDGTVLNRLSPKLLPKAGEEIQSAFYPLRGSLDQDYEKTYTGQDVFSEPLTGTELMLIYIAVPDIQTPQPNGSTSTQFGGKYSIMALVKEDHLKFIYQHQYPHEIIHKYMPYMDLPHRNGSMTKPGLDKSMFKILLQAARA